MNKLIKHLIVIVILLIPLLVEGQYLSNPSFEGPTGIGLVPPQWIAFDNSSSPDTEPLDCDNSLLPSDGDSYITLVSRGGERQYPDTNEKCYTQLINPLLPDRCYDLEFDLASRNDVGFFTWENGFISYDGDCKLAIYGGESTKDQSQLIYLSDVVKNSSWNRISFTIKPEFHINYLVLECQFAGAPVDGNISLDNFQIRESSVDSIPPIPKPTEELFIPNVFTPNNDGINDYFEILGLSPFSSLIIFNDDGKMVFRQENYKNHWNGKDIDNTPLPEGVYWYVLTEPGFSKSHKGYVYIKRE